MLYKTKIDVQPNLTKWTVNSTPKRILHFNHLTNWGFKTNKPDKIPSPFANIELSKLVVKWLNCETNKERFFEHLEKLIVNPSEEIEGRITQISWTYERMKIKHSQYSV